MATPTLLCAILLALLSGVLGGEFAALVSTVSIPGSALDKSGLMNGANGNRFGGFGSGERRFEENRLHCTLCES